MNERSTAKVIADSIFNGHRLTTLELEYPRFIHPEIMSHRAFCLSGDSILEFDLPAGNKKKEFKRLFTMPLSEFANKWFNGDSIGRSLYHRLSNMRIRQLNEDTQKIETATVKNVIISGIKEVFTIVAGGMKVSGSKDHRILTVDGWKRIEELEVNKDFIITRAFGKLDEDVLDPIRLKKFGDKWKNTWLNQSRQNKLNDQNFSCFDCGTELLIAEHDLHHIVPVYEDQTKAFEYENIVALCKDCHKERHKIQNWQGNTYLYGKPEKLTDKYFKGAEMTYDLEINSEYENFIANGIVVHNSRNAQSSRAIPVERLMKIIEDSDWYPIFMENQKGMEASKELEGKALAGARYLWDNAKMDALLSADKLTKYNVHKQIANRLLEPFSKIKVIVSATEWNNFFRLRIHPSAQQEIQELAIEMRDAMISSTPKRMDIGDWHLPYIREDEEELNLLLKKMLSTARCARVSYLNHDGTRSNIYDKELHDKLLEMKHMSPFEHIATPYNRDISGGNFRGWRQYRFNIENDINQ